MILIHPPLIINNYGAENALGNGENGKNGIMEFKGGRRLTEKLHRFKKETPII